MAPFVSVPDGLRLLTFNLHGFKNSWDYLRELMGVYDIIFVQEHWLLPTELSLLENLNSDFIVYAKSSMEEKIRQGVLTGRPFGGVAVLVRRSLCNVVTFCGASSNGRVICIKLMCRGLTMLIFGCYFPCSGVPDYSQQLCEWC